MQFLNVAQTQDLSKEHGKSPLAFQAFENYAYEFLDFKN